MNRQSPRPGTDSARGAHREAPGARPVRVRRRCDREGCQTPRAPGRGRRYCSAECAELARQESVAGAKERFTSKHGGARGRIYSRIHLLRRDAAYSRFLAGLNAPRSTSLHSADAHTMIEGLRHRMQSVGPVPEIRDHATAVQEQLIRELPASKDKIRLVVDAHELLLNLGDPSPDMHHRRFRLLQSFYVSLNGPERYAKLAWAWLIEADTYRKLQLLDLAERTFRKARDAMQMLDQPPAALRHIAAKLEMRLFLQWFPTGQVDRRIGEQLRRNLLQASEELGTAFHAIETTREMVGYFTVLREFDAAEAALVELTVPAPSIQNPYTEPSLIRAAIELRLARRDFDALPRLFDRYRALCELFRDQFRLTLMHRWARNLNADMRRRLGPIPIWPGIHIPLLY